MSAKAGSAIVLLFFGVLVGRCSVEPEYIEAAPPPPEVITETEVVTETVYEDRIVEVEVEVPVEVLPVSCENAMTSAGEAYDSLSDYDSTVGRIDRLLEELSLGLIAPDMSVVVAAEEELRLTHNDSLAVSEELADTKVQLERNIRLCYRDIGE